MRFFFIGGTVIGVSLVLADLGVSLGPVGAVGLGVFCYLIGTAVWSLWSLAERWGE